jgi:tetratricopeptide repeat protein
MLALLVGLGAMLAGCDNPEKMKDVPQEALPKVSPNPLTLKGSTVDGKVTGQFPPKYFNKSATLELTPVLVYGGQELKLPSRKYQGEKVTDNNPVVSYDNGGSYAVDFSFPYDPAMMRSDLELRLTLFYKGKSVTFDEGVKLAPGINVTQLLVENEGEPSLLPHGRGGDEALKQDAQINFAMQKSDIRNGELTSDDIVALKQVLASLTKDDKLTLKNIEIKSYASPDGPVDLNDKLSKSRGTETQKWLGKTLKSSKQDASVVNITESSTDWDGFKQMVQKSQIEDKDLILRVLDMYSDPDTRNKEMHNLGKVFQEVAEKILPELRRSSMRANLLRKGLTDEELKAIVDAKSYDQLSLTDGLYVATLYDDFMEKAAIYENLMGRFEDVRPANNLAYVYLKQNRLADVPKALDKAVALDPENPAVLNNQGVLALAQGNTEEAARLFARATAAGPEVKANLGMIAITKGNYSQAVDYLAGTDTFNQGLANLLNNNLDAAKNIFTKLPSGKAAYGLAIIGARNGDEKMIADNLKTAFERDSKLKEWAKKDVEFIRFAQSALVSALLN